MSVVLFDLMSAQVDQSGMFNGGSEFLKSLCRTCWSADNEAKLHVLLSREKFLDPSFEEDLIANVIPENIHFIEDFRRDPNLWSILGITRFYVGILQRFSNEQEFLKAIPPGVDVIGTIHDIIEHVTEWKKERMLFERYSSPRNFVTTFVRGRHRQKLAKSLSLKTFRILEQRENTKWWTDSDYSRATIIHHFDCSPGRIMTLWPAPSPNQIACLQHEKSPMDISGSYVMLAGDRWSKNLLCALRAGAILNSSGKAFRLAVFGNFWKMPISHILSKMPWVDVYNYGKQKEMLGAISKSKGLLFPTWCEGFGYPPLEALLLGRPVIASSAACVPEVLGEVGFYHSPSNPLQMAHQIISLESDKSDKSDPVELAAVGNARLLKQSIDLATASKMIMTDGPA